MKLLSNGLQRVKDNWNGCLAVVQRGLFALATLVLLGNSAFATTVTSCDTMATSPSVDNAIQCMIDTVAPYAILVAILGAFLPVILVIWGLRGGFGLMARIVGSMFAFLTRRG